ncbi:hypothetical protein ASG07_15655 [Sphingomonas sp. Leaf343]|nr:hypothetical protein ASG07_15655 [Sphingomonas sp. Leaf343]
MIAIGEQATHSAVGANAIRIEKAALAADRLQQSEQTRCGTDHNDYRHQPEKVGTIKLTSQQEDGERDS